MEILFIEKNTYEFSAYTFVEKDLEYEMKFIIFRLLWLV